MSAPARSLFRTTWAAEPTVRVIAPGRVNLMGDHVDYAGLPVLPMAIQLRLRLAAGPADVRGLEAASTMFPKRVALAGDEDPDRLSGWARYVAAAVRQIGLPESGVRIAIAGDLPSTGGLSSSSALVLGLIAAIAAVSKRHLGRSELVDLAVAAERSLGVAGGTMDQTVIVHAVAGAALRIDFEPPAHRAVPIGDGVAFVVGSSGEVAAKGADARHAYNRLSAGSRAVAVLVGRALGRDTTSLGRSGVATDALAAAVRHLPRHLGVRELERLVGLEPGSLGPLASVPVRAIGMHLLAESGRVRGLERPLADGDLDALGAAFRESQASLASIGVVSPGLERVTAAMVAAGAAGARVTGAGFGGYAVGVCAPGCVDAIRRSVVEATGGPAWAVHPHGGLHYD